MMTEAVEVTTFHLADGLTIQEFIAANADINAWLLKQPGFISRRICEQGDGSILDMLIWGSAADGHRAASNIVTAMAASPVHATIDQYTVDWIISVVHETLGAD